MALSGPPTVAWALTWQKHVKPTLQLLRYGRRGVYSSALLAMTKGSAVRAGPELLFGPCRGHSFGTGLYHSALKQPSRVRRYARARELWPSHARCPLTYRRLRDVRDLEGEIMRGVMLAGLAIVVLAACATAGLQGRIENGRYSSPNGKVAFRAPNIGGPEHGVRDIYAAGIDRGLLEETNQFGLEAVYYTSLAGLGISRPSGADENRAALTKGWTNFAMPNIFAAASPKAEVVHQEFIVDEGKEVLLAIVRLPELSGAFDVMTRKKFDAYPAVLLMIDGGYVVVLRNQFNLEDATTKDPRASIPDYLKGLRKRKSELDFRQ